MAEIRTRFAPSPTGFLHLGGLRTALFAKLFAKKNGGKFILRIEDTDRARYVDGAVEVIYDTLRECGLDWDEGPVPALNRNCGDYAPYVQSERMKSGLYMRHALMLIEKGEAYYCFCDSERMETLREEQKARGLTPFYDRKCRGLSEEEVDKRLKENIPFVIRQKAPLDGQTSFKDEIYGEITVENAEIEDQILMKSDGYPTYNFANVIDDRTMEISHIIRGNEFLSSTPKHVLLYKAFGWEPPAYIHVPQIMRDSTHKLSKRDGDAYFSDFKAKGFLAEAIVNYIALLGWAPKGENEIFTLDELTEAFGLDGISKSPALFDEVKMRAINAHYIRSMPPVAFKKLALPYIYSHISPLCGIDVNILCAALQPRTETLADIAPQVDFLERVCDYDKRLYDNKKMKTSAETAGEALSAALDAISGIAVFERDCLYNSLKEAADKSGRKIGWYLYPLQVALTGKQTAPGGGLDICLMLGKDESVKRIKEAVEKLRE